MTEKGFKFNLTEIIEKEVKPSYGCTEPAAVAFAVSTAYNANFNYIPSTIGGNKNFENKEVKIKKINIEVDRDVYKNSLAVGIPGTGEFGLDIAIALGIFLNPNDELALFKNVNQDVLEKAKYLVKQGIIEKKVVDTWTGDADIQIKAEVDIGENKGVTIIKHNHTNITYVSNNENTLYYKKDNGKDSGGKEHLEGLANCSIKEIITEVENAPQKIKNYIWEGIKMNKETAKIGLEKKLGLGIGNHINELIKKGIIGDDMINYAKVLTASACDARMSGYKAGVMSSAGSGNQGITAINPLLAVYEKTTKDKDRLINSALLSHLITSYTTFYSGYLSALCGCSVKAGMGTTAGVAYYMGGGEEEISNSINNLAGNITGMICDGAKVGGSFKLATAAEAAIQAALLGIRGVRVPEDNGIVAKRAEDTIKNVGKITKSMIPVDRTIIEIMEDK